MTSCRVFIGMLALAVGLAGLGVGVAKAKGPSHVHLKPARIIVLEDVRRSSYGTGGDSRVSSWRLHSHQAAHRHHHAAADPTVILEPTSAADAAAEDGALLLNLVVAGFVALLMLAFYWTPARPSPGRAVGDLWQPSFATVGRLDRPPRAA